VRAPPLYAALSGSPATAHRQETGTREGEVPDDLVDIILNRVGEYARARGHKIAFLAVAGPLDPVLAPPPPGLATVDADAKPGLLPRAWLELDTVPFLVDCRDTQFSLAGEAVRAVELALAELSPTTNAIVQTGTSELRREVLVDGGGAVRLYDLHQLAALTSPGLWGTFGALAKPLLQARTKISFFSATPRGGGVALMRHSLIRIWSTCRPRAACMRL
jgi:hypothetical protein